KLIEIVWEELPFILDEEEALEPGAPILRPDLVEDSNLHRERHTNYGDIEVGFAEADDIIEFTVRKKEEDIWAGVEPHSCTAEWKGDYLEVWPRTQRPSIVQRDMARYTDVSKASVHGGYQGGQFGGLEWFGYTTAFAHLPVILAKRTQRPVKMLYDGSHFHGQEECGGTYYFRIGFKNDGTITAVDVTSVQAGASLGKLHGGTKIPHQHLQKLDQCYNRPPCVCYKHGAPSTMIVTAVFEHVAGALGMDPTELAVLNDGCYEHDMEWVAENVKGPQGFDPTKDSLKECLEVGKEAIDWDNKWHLPGTKILPNGKYHGIGFTFMEGWSHSLGRAVIGLVMRRDGTANILARHMDGGWCGETTYCQVVADEVGLKYEHVNHRPFDDVGFDSAGGGGSYGMVRTLPGMVRVAKKLKQLILEKAVVATAAGELVFPGTTPEDLDIKDSVIFEKANPENILEVSQIARRIPSDYSAQYSDLFAWDYPPSTSVVEKKYIMGRQCYFMEVEVDPETGQVETKKVVLVYDAGRTMNPDSFDGQNYGGTYMGIGRTFTEAVYYDPQ
ncbi:MAG: molybdopterin-dependent oxidoreductase, partial [Gammaproteobacteria bacterium]|nr:molybdopterin-dependent oxidoreductase [Gammaproteobacteria bacterium]